jgi:hypothetical protein
VVVGLSLGFTLVVSMCAAKRIRVGVVGRVASVGGPVSVVGADVSVVTAATSSFVSFASLLVGEVLGAGSNDISRLSGDEGTVGVGHKSVVTAATSSFASFASLLVGEVLGAVSDNISGLSGDKSTVGVADGGNGKTLGGKRRGKQTDLKFSKRVSNFILLSLCCYH